jgi:hypothetical protein
LPGDDKELLWSGHMRRTVPEMQVQIHATRDLQGAAEAGMERSFDPGVKGSICCVKDSTSSHAYACFERAGLLAIKFYSINTQQARK